MTARPNLKAVADAIDAAQPSTPPAARLPAPPPVEPAATTPLDPDPGDVNADGIGPGKWVPNRYGVPDDLPVKCLGVDGKIFWFLDTIGQLQPLEAGEFGQGVLTALFMGRHHYLYWGWPRHNMKDQVTAWRAEKVREDLMAACAAKGPWTAVERVRGRGAWKGAKGGLILHTGTELWIDGREQPTGELGRFVYPKRPPILQPWPTRIDEDANPCALLVQLFRRWNWARPDVDPVLLVGWVGAAFLGGALPWRPTVFITGDKATGKSTLQNIIHKLLGGWLIQSADTTAAGIYQRIGQDSVPVSVDELEAEADSRKVKAVLKLARLAASGALMLRGGGRHQGSEFNARSGFIFSSINAPPLEPQDLSRMALLRLWRLDVDAPLPTVIPDDELEAMPEDMRPEKPVISDELLERLGSMVLRRLVDEWHRFQATFEAYRNELRQAGHDGRGQNTFGTLLGCADLIIGQSCECIDGPMGEDLTIWRERLKAASMSEFEDAAENWRLCLSHLLTAPVEAWRNGAKLTVGRVLLDFFGNSVAQTGTYEETRDKLEQAGVTLQRPSARGDPYWMAIPNQNPLLGRLFQGTKWAGEPGAGVWASALRQGPRGALWDTGQARVNGDKCKCTLISLSALYGDNGLMAEDKPKLS